jgi:hypothetical protein
MSIERATTSSQSNTKSTPTIYSLHMIDYSTKKKKKKNSFAKRKKKKTEEGGERSNFFFFFVAGDGDRTTGQVI